MKRCGHALVVKFSIVATISWANAVAADPPPAPRILPVSPAVIDDSLLIGGNDIASRKVRTRMTVVVKINGRGPYHFVVDSGADTSVIGSRLARTLALPATTPVMLNGMTERTRVDRVIVDQLQLGESRIESLELPVLKEVDLGGDGMVGIDALVEQRLRMDFETREINVEDAARPAPKLDGEIVVTAHRRKGQLILTAARANGRPVDAVIDTGSEITIGNLALRDRLLRRDREKARTIEVTGVTGATVALQLVEISELRIGSIVLHDVPIAFAQVPPFAAFDLTDHPALLLGTDLMENFRRISLDFRARKVRFQLRRCGSAGMTLSTSPYALAATMSSSGGAVCKR